MTYIEVIASQQQCQYYQLSKQPRSATQHSFSNANSKTDNSYSGIKLLIKNDYGLKILLQDFVGEIVSDPYFKKPVHYISIFHAKIIR